MKDAADLSHQVLHCQEQVGRVFPELRATVQYLYENRRQWNEMYLADIDTDTFKTPAEKGAERVGIVLRDAMPECSRDISACANASVVPGTSLLLYTVPLGLHDASILALHCCLMDDTDNCSTQTVRCL